MHGAENDILPRSDMMCFPRLCLQPRFTAGAMALSAGSIALDIAGEITETSGCREVTRPWRIIPWCSTLLRTDLPSRKMTGGPGCIREQTENDRGVLRL